VFDPLTRVSATGVLEPWLAQSWKRVGPTDWRLTLRQGVIFSSGAELDAAAVVAALDYLRSAEGQREPIGRELADITAARTVDARTLEITTKTPDPLLPYRLSLLSIPDPAAWTKLGREGFARAPVGTGPYVLENAQAARVTLKINAASWRKASLNTVTMRVLQEPAARRAALSTGDVDMAMTTISPTDFESLEAEGGRVLIDRIPAVVAMAFNTETFAPFKDARVRRALTQAVNRQAIVDTIMGGKTVVAGQPAGRAWFGYNPDVKPLPYDPEAARRLLREAGHAQGLSFEIELPTGAVSYPDVFQAMAADFAKVGVSMTVRTIPQQKIYENIQTGGWRGQAAAIPFSSPMFDALYPLKQHSCLWYAPWFCDQGLTTEIKTALNEGEAERRRAQTARIMAGAHDLAQALYLYETVSFTGLGRRVGEFPMDFGFIRYEGITLKQ
jgi:peptide/nickel transport system substrate-binding protein